jgi:double-GTPase-like protein
MPRICRLAACPLGRTGTCLEAFEDISMCPNVEPENVETDGNAGAIQRPVGVPLPLATAMAPARTYEITRGAFARVIVFAGEQRSGKTTLLASLYEAFQWGQFGALAFAGSRTLHGFERRCHLSRVASELERPDTDRTKPGEGFQFLHLRVWKVDANKTMDLLLGDMSGELYKGMRDSSDECLKYPFIARAHEFVVLLNGRKVAAGEHAEAFAHASSLVRALLDADLLGPRSHVTLLTTMWDLLDAPGKEEARRRVEELEAHFRTTLGPRVATLACARCAARPEKGDPVGIDSLLLGWISRPEPPPSGDTVLSQASARRSFDHYADLRRAASPWRGTW